MIYYLLLFFMVIYPFFWLRIIKNWRWDEIIKNLFPKTTGFKIETIGALKLFTLLFIAFIIVSVIINTLGLNDLDKVSSVINNQTKPNTLIFFIGSLFVVLFIEEFFFRAFLQKRIGIILSTMVYALLHLGYASIAEIIGAFFLGLVLAYWYKRNNSLIQNYFGHLMYDLIAIAIYVFF